MAGPTPAEPPWRTPEPNTGDYGIPDPLGQPSYWPTILISFFFGIFGLIPAFRHSRMARERGLPTNGYWWSFWLAWLVPYLIAGLLIGVLVLAVRGGSTTSAANHPTAVNLKAAVHNTLAAPNYTEVLSEQTPKGQQTDHLDYQAPDRLGGYIESGNKRTYIYVTGTTEYQSLTVSPGTTTDHLVFYKQPSQGAAAVNPVHGYLPYAGQGKNIRRSGDTYSFSLTRQGHKARFGFTVTGRYVSEFTFEVPVNDASVRLVISRVGSSPPVALPSGSKVVAAS